MAQRFDKLTRPSIRALKPGHKITEHGITAERVPAGDICYSVNIMVDGQRIHRVIGRESDGVTRAQAESFIETKRTEAREGRLNLPIGRKLHLTFRQAGIDYLAKLEETGGRNLRVKKRHIEQRLTPFFTDQRLDAISTFTVDRYKKQRRDDEAEPATINRELATLSHMLGKAVEWKWIKAKPCRVAKYKEGQGRIIALTDEQAGALMKAAVADADPYAWLFVAFGLNTAMRHSEILAARFDRIDFERRRLHVPEAKAGMREQPLTPELVEMLKRERESAADPKGWVFPTERPSLSKSGHRTRMSRPFERVVKAAGLDPTEVTPHTMRHTAITNLVRAGVDLPTIQKISGHKTLAMILRYAHVHSQHIDKAIEAIGRTVPEPSENNSSGAVTLELHKRKLRSV